MIPQESITAELLQFITDIGGRASPSFSFCHGPQDRSIPLCGRKDIIRQVEDIWKLRRDSFGCSSNRTDFRHPICVGIPGVGKTRLLEEWHRLFDGVGISETDRMGLLVLYLHGHSICQADRELPIEKTFAWRILYRHFFEGSPFTEFMSQLYKSSVYENISILNALLTVARSHNLNPNSETPLSFFLGVDEYQSISGKEVDGNDKLNRLMTALHETTLALVKYNIHLYTMFAGTKWSPLQTLSSTRDLCCKVYIPFSRNYTPIAASLYPKGMHNETFQHCLFTIGNIPRNIVAYCRGVQNEEQRLGRCPSSDYLKMIRNSVFATNSNQWTKLLPGDSMITLAAYSLSGVSVLPDSSPGIIVSDMHDAPTWQQLADRGLVALMEDCDTYTRILLPYVALQQIMAYHPPHSAPLQEVYFMQSLRRIHELPTQDMEPRQKWELFGAYFHCLCINAYMLLGYAHVALEDLFYGNKSLLSDMQGIKVALRPARVFFSDEQLSNDTNFDSIPEKQNCCRKVSLHSPRECFVVVNGTGGKGVDIYFLLQSSDPGGAPLLFLDQRNRESQSLTSGILSNYFESMPDFTGMNVRVVKCLFSALASYGKRTVQYPMQPCVVLTRPDLMLYHGSLSMHPCARCVVDPHSASQSLLFCTFREYMTDGDAKKLATEVKNLCKSSFFRTFESLCAALQQEEGGCVLNVAMKSHFFFVNDADEEDQEERVTSDNEDNEDYIDNVSGMRKRSRV